MKKSTIVWAITLAITLIVAAAFFALAYYNESACAIVGQNLSGQGWSGCSLVTPFFYLGLLFIVIFIIEAIFLAIKKFKKK